MHFQLLTELSVGIDHNRSIPGRCAWSSCRLYHVLMCIICLAGTVAQNFNDSHLTRRQLTISTQTFTTVGMTHFVVPVGVTVITATLYGASGGTVTYQTQTPAYGGKGGTISAIIPVTPGEVLQINVGGQGGGAAAGANGGGTGCTAADTITSGGGGGTSDIRRSSYTLSNRVLVAGGGGGGVFVSYGKRGQRRLSYRREWTKWRLWLLRLSHRGNCYSRGNHDKSQSIVLL